MSVIVTFLELNVEGRYEELQYQSSYMNLRAFKRQRCYEIQMKRRMMQEMRERVEYLMDFLNQQNKISEETSLS